MFVGLLRTMRPHQWVKNLFVLAPLVFAHKLFDADMAVRSACGFLLFCAASSAVYVLNDLTDLDADRAHPVKCKRPIASGRVPVRVARAAALGLATIAVGGGVLLSPAFAAAVTGYLVLNLAYSAKLKRVAYIDVLCIATGFELRVIGGALAALVPASNYLLVVTFLLASFLGFGKRMHELMQGEAAHKQRSVLRAYDERKLTVLLHVAALATVATYLVYTFDGNTRAQFGTPWLPVTTLFTVVGVFRFLFLVRGRPNAESPTEEMLRDVPFLFNLVAWVATVLILIYLT